jgi:ribosome recycling factor
VSSRPIVQETEDKMKKSLEVVSHNFAAVRTGRANAGMVEHLKVEAYGSMMPMRQVANITIPEPRMIVLQPWDPGVIKGLEKAIHESDLGLAPVVDGKFIRLSIPPLTRERREELVKIVHKLAEEARVSMRAIRRDANEKVKALEKDKTITEDESFKAQAEVQKLTDRYIGLVDQAQASKEKDLTQG